MVILGLNAYHSDAAACLVRDGTLIAAAEEERFRRIKHWAGLPAEAIRYCLREGGIRLDDVDAIAINREPGANKWRRMLFVLRHRPALALVLRRLRNIRAASGVLYALKRTFGEDRVRARVEHIEHHLAHLASAYLVSGMDQAVCLSVDGCGDFTSTAWGFGQKSRIRIDGRIYFPHSLGIFYSAITQHLGFPHFGDEYKVMGLAPSGDPRFLEEMSEIVQVLDDGRFRLNLEYFRHHRDDLAYRWNYGTPTVDRLYSPRLEQLLGPARHAGDPLQQRHRDLASSAQVIYERAFLAILNSLHQKYRCSNLALSGGCALNSVANGKIGTHSPFKKLFLPSAAGDAGGAIGAAFVVWNRLRGSAHLAKAQAQEMANGRRAASSLGSAQSSNSRENGSLGPFVMRDAYLGPQFGSEHISRLLLERRKDLAAHGCFARIVLDEQELCHETAKAIARGEVVGWFQGRMEWGPRALGNRSVLADPRRQGMVQLLNEKIKRRESFRPFAPSILREHVAEWFEQDAEVPFMMQVFRVRAEKRRLVPATTHIDGTGRLHTVREHTNSLFYHLIREFFSLTGIPMVLNTSFNESEPVVCRPEEALDCFLRTKMDVVVLGNWFIQRLCAA
jgi:carbamoyltransferase